MCRAAHADTQQKLLANNGFLCNTHCKKEQHNISECANNFYEFFGTFYKICIVGLE